MASTFSFGATDIADPQVSAQRVAHRPRCIEDREAQAYSAVRAIARRDTVLVVRSIAGSALMALGLVAVAAVVSAMLFIPHLVEAVALLGAHFFSADDLIRRDILHDLAFEAAFAWVLVFLTILFWRSRDLRHPIALTKEGGHHGH
jgi:hypothetical protein